MNAALLGIQKDGLNGTQVRSGSGKILKGLPHKNQAVFKQRLSRSSFRFPGQPQQGRVDLFDGVRRHLGRCPAWKFRGGGNDEPVNLGKHFEL